MNRALFRGLKCLCVAVIVALGGSGTSRIAAQSATAQLRAVPGELIVKYRTDSTVTTRGRARAAAAAGLLQGLAERGAARGSGHIELVRVANAASVEAAIAALRRDPSVEYAEPNWIYTHHAAAPNDPMFAQQWALENSGQAVGGTRGVADADVDALDAWNARMPAAPVYVGVIDEGIDINHPDLGVQPNGPIWTNPFDPIDGVDNDGNGYIDDLHGWDFAGNDNSVYDGTTADTSIDSHGTHVAGTIAARRSNGIGVAGVTSGVVVIPAKFLGLTGGTTAAAIDAVDYLTDLKVRHGLNIVAINNSWGGGGFSQALLDAIARAAREQILFIAASGNGGPDSIADDNDAVPSFPAGYNTTAAAGYDSVIAVTATGQSDELMPWANYGATTVDLSAPGALIASTTPQNTYSYSSGTSMATPHVTGAAALASATRGVTGPALRDVILGGVDLVPALAGKTSTGGRLNLAHVVPASAATTPTTHREVVLRAAQAKTVVGNWSVATDPTAAAGSRLQSRNLAAAKVVTAAASPAHYFEMTFTADAGVPYRLWLRARAENNNWANDSVHVQFDRSVNAAGAPVYRIGTTASTEVNLEDCSGCGLANWGWQDNGYGAGVRGPVIYFAAAGTQRIRIQTREDGIGIDQIVLSASRYLSASPGALKNDATILGGATTPASPPRVDEIALYATDARLIAGGWTRTTDTTAAGGARMQSVNAGAAKITTALANPINYFELTFRADAGRSYRLWLRGKAISNNWANDSVHVQFNDSLTTAGAATYRIGSTSAAEINLEDCSGCGLAGWGWQDTGYGAGVLGPEIRFATTGLHTVRVQVREDGIGVDQLVLSAVKYRTAAPGPLKNDATILPRAGQ